MHSGGMSSTQPTPSQTYRLSRRARWGVPAVAVIAVAGAIGVPLMSADASPSLPAKTAGQLLADVAAALARLFSGTVVETARLGPPAVPGPPGDTEGPLQMIDYWNEPWEGSSISGWGAVGWVD